MIFIARNMNSSIRFAFLGFYAAFQGFHGSKKVEKHCPIESLLKLCFCEI